MDPRDVLSRPMRGPDHVLRYDDHGDALIDVFLPRADAGADADGDGDGHRDGDGDLPSPARPTPTPAVDSLGAGPPRGAVAPLVMFLHGGFWREEWDRIHARPLAWGLAATGFVVATPEYRRGRSSWASMSADVDASLGAIRGLVDSAAPGCIDVAAPLVLSGHSAGGHLALWAGLRADPGVVRRIVALAPVSDLGYAARTRMGDDAVRDLLGGGPADVPESYAAADVVPLLPGRVPVNLIHGDADQQVTVEMNRQVARDVSPGEADATFRYVEMSGVDHFSLIDPESDAWPTVLRALTS